MKFQLAILIRLNNYLMWHFYGFITRGDLTFVTFENQNMFGTILLLANRR